ncbi:hypothetical protein [Anaerofustis sp.]|uniref:hypothetical protein n=1 Tax=Anaerofustis sp. TaxID=1872517 RepID=UPI0025C69E84|nr:hypothetical protein [Anaerofustis sp.]
MITKDEYEILSKVKRITRQECLTRGYQGYQNCTDCKFDDICNKTPICWDLKKISKNFIITKEEYNVLKNMDNKYKDGYIARDKNGELWIFEDKPVKYSETWDNSKELTGLKPFSDMFPNIRWEDEESRKISDYIKEYEEIHGL